MSVIRTLTPLSLFANKISCGPEGYTLCARFYEGRLEESFFHKHLVTILDSLFFWDKNHCRKSWLLRRKK